MNLEKDIRDLKSSKVSPKGGDLEGAFIRRAEKKDCKRLMELIYQLAIYEKAPNEMTVSLQHFEESGFGEKPVWWAFVATSPPTPLPGVERGAGGEVVGFALYYVRYSTWKGQRMYLEDFLVNEEMRGKGIGKLLFDKLIEEAKERKFNGIVWQVLDWNEPAINFYKKYDGVTIENGWLNCSINF